MALADYINSKRWQLSHRTYLVSSSLSFSGSDG